MIVVGSLIVLALFVLVGWAVSVEMFRHRWWRRRVESGDLRVIAGLILEAMAGWRRSRPPRDLPAAVWAGICSAELVAVSAECATVSAVAEPEYRSEGGQRVLATPLLDVAQWVAVRLVDMMLYDVPNLRMPRVRVDVYTTFTGDDGVPVQRPILSVTASRRAAEGLPWESLTPAEVLARFEARMRLGPAGQPLPIDLPEPEGVPPAEVASEGVAPPPEAR
ncbi:hypothetical protein HRbin29_01269 [bacterium HR29]|jgi:hypothetical protein|nr:hypothetical protein HRbin29_01269 [bacterium HR29]